MVGGREGIAEALSSTVRAPRWLHLVPRSLSPCSCIRHSIVQTARQCRRSELLIDWSRVEIGCSLCGSACDARAVVRSAVATTVVRGRTRAVLWPISQIPRRRYIASSDPCPSGGNRDRLYSHALRRRRRRRLPDGCSVRAVRGRTRVLSVRRVILASAGKSARLCVATDLCRVRSVSLRVVSSRVRGVRVRYVSWIVGPTTGLEISRSLCARARLWRPAERFQSVPAPRRLRAARTVHNTLSCMFKFMLVYWTDQ